jgi:hypothetical protein
MSEDISAHGRSRNAMVLDRALPSFLSITLRKEAPKYTCHVAKEKGGGLIRAWMYVLRHAGAHYTALEVFKNRNEVVVLETLVTSNVEGLDVEVPRNARGPSSFRRPRPTVYRSRLGGMQTQTYSDAATDFRARALWRSRHCAARSLRRRSNDCVVSREG